MRTVATALGLVLLPVCLSAQAAVMVSPAKANAIPGETVRFSAIVHDSTGAVVANPRINWVATPFDVAWADSTGTIHPVRTGTVQVLAIANGNVGTATMAVGSKPPSSLQVEVDRSAPGADATIMVDGTTVVHATPRTNDNEPLRDVRVTFRSLLPAIATVSASGVVTGVAPGVARIAAEAQGIKGEVAVKVVANPVRRLVVSGPETARTGDVLRFNARALNAEGTAVPNAPVLWSVAGDGASMYPDGGFVAERPGTYVVSASVGKSVATTPVTVTRRVLNRRLDRVSSHIFSDMQMAEGWAINDVLYVSTIGDRLYAFDISTPGSPVLADSLQVDAHVINDISTTPDGRIGVMTREGASNRRNGIVFLDLAQPLHPKVLSEYTATVTGGVHSAFINGHYVYATDDATGSMRVIDFADPKAPKEVARWEVPGVGGAAGQRDSTGQITGGSVGRMLHDLQVKDGLAYLAYWRHGLITLDVGNGVKGGSPEHPVLVSQYTYNVGDYYPPDRIAGTHTVFRYKNYLFVGDEVFPGIFNLTSRNRIEAMGQVHVLDVTDIEHPRKVADYKMPGGSHNLWVDDDVLYIGAYEGGIRALDVSGDLRGDLAAEGREFGSVWSGSPTGFRPNLPFAWGAQPHKGFVYSTDINSGVWVTKLVPLVVP